MSNHNSKPGRKSRAAAGARRSVALLLALLAVASPGAAQVQVGHGLAMHGEPRYGPDFQHFDYVNPEAPKGGTVRLSSTGTFDNLNGFILKGVSAAGLGLLYDTLMAPSDDEVFSSYGLLAETVEVPEDRSWATFTLRQ